MKIPFEIKYRPQIESGEYKVETRDGLPARVICWNRRGERPLVVLVQQPDGFDDGRFYYESGLADGVGQESDGDLFIVTPEEEMSEFEKAVGLEIFDEPFEERHINVIKEESAKLLAIAREQLIKDGYVIEKKEFHDAVEKVAPEVMKEVSDKVDMEGALRLGYEKGRADALKNLPRWKKWENGAAGNSYGHPIALVSGAGGIRFVSVLGIIGEKYIMLADLKKLPGFKEDEK